MGFILDIIEINLFSLSTFHLLTRYIVPPPPEYTWWLLGQIHKIDNPCQDNGKVYSINLLLSDKLMSEHSESEKIILQSKS